MPTDKDFKRLVRGRMQKTGESYTAARAHLRKHKPTCRPPPFPAPADYARLAGRSDAILKENTGCTWERWVKALDREKAYTWPHREIAKYVHEKYKIPGWWAQTVTVGYERIKGLRAVGQRRDGSFEANKSKTFAVPLAELYRAFHDPRTRARWLPGRGPHGSNGDAREVDADHLAGPDLGRGRLPEEGARKEPVALSHGKLPDIATRPAPHEGVLGRATQRVAGGVGSQLGLGGQVSQPIPHAGLGCQ